ncbi:IclR family transcriptional regulator [Nocardia terpenica]|uniref:IclR family transcriptional regulator n=1 Tax=Nocardia terpenica TaxID=455432 RepID=UPI001893AC6D|nr:IclR family transcriptional regulator [Nocardia terpenica]MBF6060373.1 IclR family transcriptional regulator [Nocardia terpenica]MBF6103633.1 IclR family transcriptional regulator [Nocardia terpenica]MBF6111993.1 IclR family transcriptional regulator [Nocardia terpenica]MBF6117854.1 IclR family transcriptional regulator [Nocardia terpenica]MBF6153402.1 IclR family transcriptional regulator [Nocardia terpenica]
MQRNGHADRDEASATGVKSARRAIALLEVFAANRSWLSLAEMHAATGFPRSSLHGLLRTLRAAEWIECDETGTRFRLGVRALICGTAYLDRDPAVPFATAVLERLRDDTGFTAHYARLSGTEVVYLETRESRRSDHLISRVGRTLPAHATALGKALLAELADPELADLLPPRLAALTAHTRTDRDTLYAELGVVRERGYATEREEGTAGVACAAAAVPYRIPATDAVSCSMPMDRVTEGEQHRIGAVLRDAAAELARQLRRAGIR